MTKSVFVPWNLLNAEEQADIQRVIDRADNDGVIQQTFLPFEGNPKRMSMTREFEDINQILSSWDKIADDDPMLNDFFSSEHEQTWLRASFGFNEIEFIENGDIDLWNNPEMMYKTLKCIKSDQKGAPMIVIKSILHLC